jgi:uncharacterized membrane protein YccC
VTNTLLGGVLALLGARLLWPAPEWARLPSYMAAALRANRDYLRTVVSIFADRSDAAGHLMRERRRQAALAAINAEESFQRLLGEHGGSVGALAPVMTFLTYVRRFTVSTAALAVSRHAVDPSTAHVLERFSERTTTRLDEAAARLTAVAGGADVVRGSPMATDHDLDAATATSDPVVRARLKRLSRQLETLVTAADDVVSLGAAELGGRK